MQRKLYYVFLLAVAHEGYFYKPRIAIFTQKIAMAKSHESHSWIPTLPKIVKFEFLGGIR